MSTYYRHCGTGREPRITTSHPTLRKAKRFVPGYVWAQSGDGETWFGYESRKDMRADENGSKPWLVLTTITITED